MADLRIIERAGDSAVTDWLESRLQTALARGPAAIAVPGGSTPFPILAELATRRLDWPRLSVWPTDDRIVASTHPASNIGRIEALLAPTGATTIALGEHAKPPHFALVWLGMGEDGHVASLFPNTNPRADDPLPVRRLTPDPLPPEAPFERLTLAMPALLDSDEIAFVIRGEAKRRLFEAAARGENDLPVARLLAVASQPVTCFA